MILVLAAIYAWIAFYISWQIHRLYTKKANVIFSALYAISVALIAYGLTMHHLFSGSAEQTELPGPIIDALAKATPACVAGFLILMPTVLVDMKKLRSRAVTKRP